MRFHIASLTALLLLGHVAQADELFAPLGTPARTPIGWVEFCADHSEECNNVTSEARNIVLTQKSWKDLVRVNKWVNDNIMPLNDIDHWGVVERWSYPDDGYGDCEDYVLEKRRMLIRAGWPQQALLITVVRDSGGGGHAVLTVKTDKGEYILDSLGDKILLWSEVPYRFIKRQSQTNPNVWYSIGDARPSPFVVGKGNQN